ncbi:MAG: molybdopterin-dependent oxidoreductase [Eggerthellaceae bacterium]|nr:molybdopterin-dependent oxidoreductase [Eggerthellaceae bacterium]
MSTSNVPQRALTRRSFLKATGAVAGAAAVTAAATPALTALAAQDAAAPAGADVVGYGVCRSNCMQSCRYQAHVRDGKLVKLTPADYGEDLYRGSCLRGMSYMHRIYSPERIKYPMRRVEGTERGAGQWERISWDEAISDIASHFQAIIDEYGPKAIAFDFGTGNYGEIQGQTGIFNRLGGMLGVSKPAGMNDLSTGYGIDRVLGTGLMYFANEAKSVLDSSHIFIWGSNPVHSTPQNWRWMQRAKEQGAKIITIDPVKSATAHKSDEYFAIKPTTDGYLALAMANHILANGLQDDEFIAKRSTAPFLVRDDTGLLLHKSDFEAVAEGEDDPAYVWDEASGAAALYGAAASPALEGRFDVQGIPCTTSYTLLKERIDEYTVADAARVCGMSEEDIVYLAEELAGAKAASVNISFGMDHYANGYQSCWAIAILLSLTGQVGRDGAGFTGIFLNTALSLNLTGLWAAKGFKGMATTFPMTMLHQVVETQELHGEPYPMKALVSIISNSVSNWPAQNNYLTKIIPNLDFILAMDMEMTDTARHADIVLPAASFYENEDFRKAHNLPYIVHQDKVIEPLYEAKDDVEIASLIGRAMGLEAAFPESATFETYATALLKNESCQKAGVTLERLREEGYIDLTVIPGKPGIVGRAKFPTKSGLAQLYTEKPAPRVAYGQDVKARFPKEHLVYYQESAEVSENSEAAKKFPIVFYQEHSRWRTHSQWFNSPLLKELDPKPVYKISAPDAAERGIASGDVVEVFNDRGHMVVECVIDPSLPAGVSRMPKGWQRDQFIEGGYQELTYPDHDEWSVAFNFYDTRVDVRKK